MTSKADLLPGAKLIESPCDRSNVHPPPPDDNDDDDDDDDETPYIYLCSNNTIDIHKIALNGTYLRV